MPETLTDIDRAAQDLQQVLDDLGKATDEPMFLGALERLREISYRAYKYALDSKAPDGSVSLEAVRPIIILLRKSVGTVRKKQREIPIADHATYQILHDHVSRDFLSLFHRAHNQVATFSTYD